MRRTRREAVAVAGPRTGRPAHILTQAQAEMAARGFERAAIEGVRIIGHGTRKDGRRVCDCVAVTTVIYGGAFWLLGLVFVAADRGLGRVSRR